MPLQAQTPPPLILVAHRARHTVDLLCSLLTAEGYSVLGVYDGRACRHYLRQHQPALLLADQALPVVDGRDLCRELRRDGDSPPVFILSDHPDEHDKLLAFAAGADDFLPLPIHPRELLGRVQAALRRSQTATRGPDGVLRCGQIELDLDRREARAGNRILSLTGLEYELLATLVRHPGHVFTRDALLARLAGFVRGEPFGRAVDIHVSNVRRKVAQALGTSAPIETVRGVGYRLRAEAVGIPAAPHTPDSATLDRLALRALRRAPLPMLVLSVDRTVLLYNEAAEHLCGWTGDEVAGQVKCYSLLGCHSENGVMLCHDQCPLRGIEHAGASEQQTRYVITLKDGREVPVAASYTGLSEAGDSRGATLLVLQPQG
jgi:DNA-binding response OmpR family regulator